MSMVPEDAEEQLQQAIADAVANGGNFECMFHVLGATNWNLTQSSDD